MAIWKTNISLDTLNQDGQTNMAGHLGIEFTEVGDNDLTARMPVNQKTQQPLGLLHGGASCVLAETVGSRAANYCIDPNKYYCVGLDINANHVRSIQSGFVIAKASPIHLGKKTHVWEIIIKDEAGHLICISRLTMAIMSRQ